MSRSTSRSPILTKAFRSQLGFSFTTLVQLFDSEVQRATMAARLQMLPPELTGQRESWQEDSAPNPITAGSPTFNPGMFCSLGAYTRILAAAFDPTDPIQISLLRDLLGIGVKLCRESFEQQPDKRSIAAQGWMLTFNQLNNMLRLLASMNNAPPKTSAIQSDHEFTDEFEQHLREIIDGGDFELRLEPESDD